MNKVKLTYFKPSGKYYSEGELVVPEDRKGLWQVCSTVCKHMENRTLPGLVKGHSHFTVLVEQDDDDVLLYAPNLSDREFTRAVTRRMRRFGAAMAEPESVDDASDLDIALSKLEAKRTPQ